MNKGMRMRMLTNGGRNGNGQSRNGGRWDDQNRTEYYGRNENETGRSMYDSRDSLNETRRGAHEESTSMRQNRNRMREERNRTGDERGSMRGMYGNENLQNGEEHDRRQHIGRREYSRSDEWDDDEDNGRQTIKAGGVFWMDGPEEGKKLTKEKAKEWVHHMRNADPAYPTGEKWSMEELKGMAQKKGIDPESERFVEFYAVMNAMYSDYAEVAKQFGVSKPEFYAAMAMAWMNDKDAKENKTEIYYRCIAKK